MIEKGKDIFYSLVTEFKPSLIILHGKKTVEHVIDIFVSRGLISPNTINIEQSIEEIEQQAPLIQRAPAVDRRRMEHQVKQGAEVEGEQFFLCKTPECEVAYYTQDRKEPILQEELVDKIWFKNVPSPVPICYCAKVTGEEILYHVAVAKCCSSLENILGPIPDVNV